MKAPKSYYAVLISMIHNRTVCMPHTNACGFNFANAKLRNTQNFNVYSMNGIVY